MDEFIHVQSLALYRRRLAESCDEAQRQMLLKLLAEEEAKQLPPRKKIVTVLVIPNRTRLPA